MTTVPKIPDQRTKIVVAFLDGRRLKGYSFNFSALNEFFDLFPQEKSLGDQGIKVPLKDVKAVFFVKDFAGNAAYGESQLMETRGPGRSLEITFADGEKVRGRTMGYNPQKIGFFVIPIDPGSNNARIFVVNRNTRQIKPI